MHSSEGFDNKINFMKKIIIILFIISYGKLFAQSSWQEIHSFPGYINGMDFINNSTGFIATDQDLEMTTNGGINWTQVYNSKTTSVQFINSVTGFAASGTITYKTTNSGTNWIPINHIARNSLEYMVDTLYGYAYGVYSGQKYLLKTIDGAQNWFPLSGIGYFYDILDFCFFNRNNGLNIMYYGDEPVPYSYSDKTSNGGTNWETTIVNAGAKLTKFNENIAYCGGNNRIYKTIDQGNSWQSIQTNIPSQYYSSVYFINTNTGFACGGNMGTSNGSIIKTTNGGQNWNPVYFYAPSFFTKIMFTDSLSGYAVTENLKLFKTTTGGGVTGIPQNSIKVAKYTLEQNYPNPFNPTTKINYDLPNSNFVTLKVYDVHGSEIETLVIEDQNAGSYSVSFNASNYPSGVYFYKLETNGFSETKKMVLVK